MKLKVSRLTTGCIIITITAGGLTSVGGPDDPHNLSLLPDNLNNFILVIISK